MKVLKKNIKPLRVIKIFINAFLIINVVFVGVFFVAEKTDYVEGEGRLFYQELHNKYSPFEGSIKKIYKNFGDIVKKGDTILEIDTSELEVQILKNRIALYNIKAQIAQKELEIGRREQKRNDAADIQQKILAIEKSALCKEYEMYKKKEEGMKCALRGAKIKADDDGLTVITAGLLEREGTKVQQGTLLFTLAEIEKYKMIAEFNENDIAKIKQGQKVIIILDAVPYEKYSTFDGEIKKVYPQSSDEKLYKQVEIEIKGFTQKQIAGKQEKVTLKSGMKGRVRVITGENERMIKFFINKVFGN
ncbi:MAG: efflux RND transporter periplasmic adaptor subunit [Clostridia bacterium]|nr:efflux RND transporter periplasmic adaptor subunit [Clostridia bacterium]